MHQSKAVLLIWSNLYVATEGWEIQQIPFNMTTMDNPNIHQATDDDRKFHDDEVLQSAHKTGF